MLRSHRQLYGKKLGASDGDIGHVRDFYFNDQQWTIRYVVADTGSWLSGRLVLISPHAFGNLHQDGDCLLVNLTRQQIENSPAIESHKPVSLQYQAYWDGVETWGVGGFPEAPPPPHLMPGKQASDDVYLQSTQALRRLLKNGCFTQRMRLAGSVGGERVWRGKGRKIALRKSATA